MGACGGAVAAWLHSQFITKSHSFGDLCNGALCGLVAITAGASVIAPWAGILAGAIGAIVFLKMEPLIASLGIDDAVGASAMHGCIGFWGTLVPGLFTRADYTRQLMGEVVFLKVDKEIQGLFYGGDGKILGCQIIGTMSLSTCSSEKSINRSMLLALSVSSVMMLKREHVHCPPVPKANGMHAMHQPFLNYYFLCAAAVVIGLWVVATMAPLFAGLKMLGLLRVTEHAEDVGLDVALHGGPCYAEASEASPAPADEHELMSAKVSPE